MPSLPKALQPSFDGNHRPDTGPRSAETPAAIAVLGLALHQGDALEQALSAKGWRIVEPTSSEPAPTVILATSEALRERPLPGRGPAGGRPPSIVLVLAPAESSAAMLPPADEYLESPFSPALAVHRIASALRLREQNAAPLAPESALGLAQLASADLLVGRHALEQALERAVGLARPGDGAMLLILGVGLESVERGAHGRVHQILARALHALRGELAAPDSGIVRHDAARVDHGRYALHVTGALDEKRAGAVATRLHELVTHAFEEEWGEAAPAVHVGHAFSLVEEGTARELLERGEIAAYCAGQQRKSRVQAFSESMSRWARERKLLVEGLRHAAERNELVVYYQPRVDAQTRRVVGMEALVRWVHPELGLVAPGRFIPLAEESGLIVPIGEWVLREACRQTKDWQERGFAPIHMSVNLSAVQFRQPDLFETVARTLEEVGVAPGYLELELTESMLMNDPRKTIATLERFKNAGIHLSIDDFGTGYSSLSYLRRFPIDALKIDRSFVREVTTNPDDAAIATTIILMGHSLKLSVVAEGVETESQLSFLQILQCNEIQGYLISPPVPPAKAEGFLLPGTLAHAPA